MLLFVPPLHRLILFKKKLKKMFELGVKTTHYCQIIATHPKTNNDTAQMKARVYEDPTECQALSNPLTFLRVSIKTT